MQEQVDDLRRRLVESKRTAGEIARAADGELSRYWISLFRRGEIKNPTINSLAKLASALTRLGE